MTYYTPVSPYLVGHHLKHGFLSQRSLEKIEGGRPSYALFGNNVRTLVFDSPEWAAEWWAGAYGTEIVVMQINGDVTVEEDSPRLLDGMHFLTGEIPPEQVSVYQAPAIQP